MAALSSIFSLSRAGCLNAEPPKGGLLRSCLNPFQPLEAEAVPAYDQAINLTREDRPHYLHERRGSPVLRWRKDDLIDGGFSAVAKRHFVFTRTSACSEDINFLSPN